MPCLSHFSYGDSKNIIDYIRYNISNFYRIILYKMDSTIHNLLSNNSYNSLMKNEVITTMNRINHMDNIITQYERTMEHILLYNTLNEEIIYIYNQKNIFNQYFDDDITRVFDKYFENIINRYNEKLLKMDN